MARSSVWILLLVFLLMPANGLRAAEGRRPLLGSQIWFEPGDYDTDQEIDQIFKTLADNQMPVARVGMIWNYMERTPGQWDFALYDRVFRSAEKHGVKIVATLWPQAKTRFLTGIPDTEENLEDGERYLRQVVGRYRSSPALDTWLIMNEPGQGPRANPLAVRRFRAWLQRKYGTIGKLNQHWLQESMVPDRPPYTSFDEIEYDSRWALAYNWPVPGLDWATFWRAHLTWYMNWIADRVRAIDPKHPLHVNPNPVVSNLASRSLDLPAWRPFLDTIGASAYPAGSWPMLRRDQYALGFSYMVDMLRGVFEPKPVWVTEIPGGNITYAQNRAFTASPDEMSQWVWASVGAGAERCIFWLLNARRKARETGEFGLLDYQGRPGDRLKTISSVADTINRNASLFEDARPIESPVIIFLSLETMTLQDHYKSSSAPGRDRDAHLLSVLSYYQGLSELGIPAGLRQVHDFDWRSERSKPILAILPHATALTEEQVSDISAFVRNGNTLLMTGFTGFYSTEGYFLPMKKFPFSDLIGAGARDTRTLDERAKVELTSPRLTLPSHLWVVEIDNQDATVIGRQEDWVTAVRRKAGKGEMIWVPSPVGLAAWLGDRKPLSDWLSQVAQPFAVRLPVRFASAQRGCLMRTMQSGRSLVTVVMNQSEESRTCEVTPPAGRTPHVIWGEAPSLGSDFHQIFLKPKQTLVAVWQ